MKEKEREMEEEEEEEEEGLVHFIHDHPLTLIQTVTTSDDYCYACWRPFLEEAAYGCKKCSNKKFLHTHCAEMPRRITHYMHPHHTLLQQLGDGSRTCALCGLKIKSLGIGYLCTSSGCDFQIHICCAVAAGVKQVEQISKKHPSHPQHHLILMTKMLSFQCDACDTMETGRSYVCVACQYCIHEGCAALPATADHHHLHRHPLSLAFYLPTEYYFPYIYRCDVCRKYLPLNRWVYHCPSCRYVVHIKCAITAPTASSDDADAGDDAQGVIQFPINEVHEELIKPFVIRERGEMVIPRNYDQKYCFPLHHHQLNLVSSSILESNDDEDEDEDDDIELTCDACTMPIFQKIKILQPSSSSSSSSSSSEGYKYMSCSECKYFLHLACFQLPPELPSHPLHQAADHKLILKACPKLNFFKACSMCSYVSNGLRYACTRCDFKADIKCASLPSTIKHRAHPHHHLYSKFVSMEENIQRVWQGICGGCPSFILGGIFYKCGGSSCDFMLCKKCVLLPPANKHRLEKHLLPLRYDARLDHPGDFYCDDCEHQMDPQAWMYHCRRCDTSFHPDCFPSTSGYCRNIKFGQQYNVSPDLHPHPLTFRLLATKLYCDVCGFRVYGDDDFDQRGFHCSSCNFFMCLERCIQRHGRAICPID